MIRSSSVVPPSDGTPTGSSPTAHAPLTEAAPGEASTLPAADFLAVAELAALLRVNHKTVRDAIARGEIPGVRRIGGVIRIHRATVVNWFTSGQGNVSRSKRLR